MPRLLLAPFTILPLWIGAAYILGNPSRTSSAAFNPAKALLSGLQGSGLEPMQAWGLLFTGEGILVLCMIAAGHPLGIMAALQAGGALGVWWGLVFAWAAVTDPNASLTGPAIYGFVAFCYFLAAWRIRVQGHRL